MNKIEIIFEFSLENLIDRAIEILKYDNNIIIEEYLSCRDNESMRIKHKKTVYKLTRDDFDIKEGKVFIYKEPSDVIISYSPDPIIGNHLTRNWALIEQELKLENKYKSIRVYK